MPDCKLYVSQQQARFFEQHTRDFVVKSDMPIVCIENGIITADTHTGAYGVLDAHGKFVPQSRCLRDNNGQFIPKVSNDDIPYMDVDAVFCGSSIGHFGHFLLEGMNRAYAALDKKYKDAYFVFVTKDGVPAPRYIAPLMAGVGVSADKLMFVDRPMRFRRVFVPAQGFNIPRWSSVQFGETYRAISDFYKDTQSVTPHDKIYVSRGAMPERRTFGENQIERIFQKNGFKVIYPETLPLPQQIAIMSHCRVLAGCAGTALHLALFMPRGGRVIQIKRNGHLKDSACNQNMINQTIDLDFVYISGSIEDALTDHFTECPQIIGVTEYMRKFFDDNGFEYTDADIAPNTDEIAAYRDAMSEYVRNNGTSGNIKLKKKFVKLCIMSGAWARQSQPRSHVDAEKVGFKTVNACVMLNDMRCETYRSPRHSCIIHQLRQ